ncbi:MAG: 2-octaprenyl-6-methoxyphenyl hydroxylase [Gammaproteobacteria bacterium]|nr:2-octaprenyl-6-methoxyphenyl hydroxylase [Gammaproteobacteria bacterium]NIR81908.1 2-octaprenyl-6-methoxyphenyl hydroxylase [Gammaproteobacteria bacterium]NIR88740.1 2-octaprenyl-6-methoxyphenyl hydroxylase [Gammaproteobacteria bacterium]NIU03016.1 2-octaprenyl-6-methoxyphenyl hydroxylase [Gammaproteobacteria bacterium]NIV50537.1 2-octaprenyl-6-methoxyphenyl hydroxylase [Gammaproteobacteria bacterium]
MSYEVAIVGAGPVGVSLACALGGAGVGVVLLESRPGGTPGAATSAHGRPIALSLGSKRILDTLGAWEVVGGHANPIEQIHVSDRGGFGFTRLRAAEHGVEALGYVVAANALEEALEVLLAAQGSVDVLRPARVRGVSLAAGAARLEADTAGGTRRLEARLLIAADGGRSRVREALGIGVRTRAYGQVAVVARVLPQKPHFNTAYERFTDSGPLALLPMRQGWCGLVWSTHPPESEHLLSLDDEPFLSALTRRFGQRLGGFGRVQGRSAYPLQLVRSREHVRSRLAIIGNAAHQLHPVAGQGLNLGLRDAAALAEVVVEAVRSGTDPGALRTVERYAAWRGGDQDSVTWFTDALVRLFSSRLGPLRAGRDLGLLALDLVPGLKAGLARRAMGLAGRQTRLARGLSL